jgi:cysteine desulfurase
MQKPIYLDYAATTPIDPRVATKMMDCLSQDGCFGNAASVTHVYGREAKNRIETAREQIAQLINAHPKEIIFTSGATESNNLALKGIAQFYRYKGNHIITCKTEHKSILDTCHQLQKQGLLITYLDPEPNGLIDLEKLQSAITPQTLLISIMHVNNEFGTIQDIANIGALCKSQNIFFHVDATQSVGKVPIDLQKMSIDLMSFSAHKIYGPKGIGALYVRSKPKIRLTPLLHGGNQEQGYRSGTLPTHQIVGMGEACAIATEAMSTEIPKQHQLRNKLWEHIKQLPQVYLNGCATNRVSNNLNISVAGVDGEALIHHLTDIAVSTGSACNSITIEPSYALRALGIPAELAHSSLRISLGRFTTESEIEYAGQHIIETINKLRNLNPLWNNPTFSKLDNNYSSLIRAQNDACAFQLEFEIKNNKIKNAQFKALGPPELIALGSYITSYAVDLHPENLLTLTSQKLIKLCNLPAEKFFCSLIAEDAIKQLIQDYHLQQNN